MEFLNKIVAFIQGIIDAIKSLVGGIRDFNDGVTTTAPAEEETTIA